MEATARTQRTARTDTVTLKEEGLGVYDSKGREMGLDIYFWEETYVQGVNEYGCGYLVEAGHYYCLAVRVTRAGRHFGASHRPQMFTSEAARAKAIPSLEKAARKRAAKTAAPAGAAR